MRSLFGYLLAFVAIGAILTPGALSQCPCSTAEAATAAAADSTGTGAAETAGAGTAGAETAGTGTAAAETAGTGATPDHNNAQADHTILIELVPGNGGAGEVIGTGAPVTGTGNVELITGTGIAEGVTGTGIPVTGTGNVELITGTGIVEGVTGAGVPVTGTGNVELITGTGIAEGVTGAGAPVTGTGNVEMITGTGVAEGITGSGIHVIINGSVEWITGSGIVEGITGTGVPELAVTGETLAVEVTGATAGTGPGGKDDDDDDDGDDDETSEPTIEEWSFGMTRKLRFAMLAKMDGLRGNLALGIVPNGKGGGFLRRGNRMRHMKYSFDMERKALRIAKLGAEIVNIKPSIHQTILVLTAPKGSIKGILTRNIQKLWSEITTRVEPIDQIQNLWFSHMGISNWALMASDLTTHMGCAFHRYEVNGEIKINIVLQYRSQLSEGAKLYATGPTCNKCKDTCANGLCPADEPGQC